MNCSTCGSDDVHSKGKRYALYPAGIVSIIGFPLAMLHQASTPRDYHCNACGLDFSHRTTAERIARFFFVTTIIGLLGLAVIFIIAIASGAIS